MMLLSCSALARRTAAAVASRPAVGLSTPRGHLLALATLPASSSSSMSIHTTAALAIASKTWGGGKLKTHKGAAKRFFALGKRRTTDKRSWSEQSGYQIKSPAQIKYANDQTTFTRIVPPTRQIGVLFKSGQAGAQHGMTGMSNRQLTRKGPAVVQRRKSVVKLLSRLIGYRKRK